jgi:hypothetical protein
MKKKEKVESTFRDIFASLVDSSSWKFDTITHFVSRGSDPSIPQTRTIHSVTN